MAVMPGTPRRDGDVLAAVPGRATPALGWLRLGLADMFFLALSTATASTAGVPGCSALQFLGSVPGLSSCAMLSLP